jgi:hypothetical protein
MTVGCPFVGPVRTGTGGASSLLLRGIIGTRAVRSLPLMAWSRHWSRWRRRDPAAKEEQMIEEPIEVDLRDRSGVEGTEPARTAEAATAPSESVRTGDSRIDEVLDGLAALDDADIDNHPAHYSAVHETLREALSSPQPELDEDE